jgi:hypothetical protein
LNHRPKLAVRVCGRATTKDLAGFSLKDLKEREVDRKAPRPPKRILPNFCR